MDATSSSDASVPVRPRASERNVVLAAKGGGLVFGGMAFAFGTRLLIGIMLARLLGAEHYGLYSLAYSAVGMAVGLAALGLDRALLRYVSMFAGRRDAAGLWGSLQVGLGLTAIASLLVGGGLFVLATPIAELIFEEPRLVPLLRLGSLMIPFMTLGNALSTATQGFKKMQYAAIGEISQPLIKLLLIAAFALAVGLTALNALATHLLAAVAVFAMLLYFLDRLFALRRPLQEGRRNPRRMLKFSLPVYATSLLRKFGGNLKTLLLGAFQAIDTVGVFTVASRINTIGRMFQLSVAATSAPIVSGLYDQGKRGQLSRFYQTMTKWTFTVYLPIFVTIQLFPGELLSIFGSEYVGGALALSILAWGNLADAGTGICGEVIDMTGKTRLKLVNAIVALGLSLGLSLLLIPRWGLVGAATATAAANTTLNLLRLAEVYLLYRMLPYNLTFLKPIAAGLVALAAVWVVRQWLLTGETLILTAIKIAILLAVYVSSIVLLGLDQEDRVVLGRISERVRARLQR